MIILGIDSSSITASCAVIKEDEIKAKGFVKNGHTHSQTLLPLIQDTMKKAGVSVNELDLIAITNGPGSFTGLRIGLSTVKGMASVFQTKCIGVSSLEAAAFSLKDFSGIVCAVMDARCKQVYNALFENGKRLCEDRTIAIDQLLQELKEQNKKIILVGDGARLCYNEFKELDSIQLCDESVEYVQGESVAELGKINFDLEHSAKELLPIYLQIPQAQRELKAKPKGN